MKKIIIFTLFLSNYAFGQSVTIVPTNGNAYAEALKIQKGGIGLDQRSSDGSTGVGTYVIGGRGYIQTHTNHPLSFATGNGSPKMSIATNGNVGIGTTTPAQRLHVDGNGYFTENLTADGNLSANGLTIGGGNTITKIFKAVFTNQTFPALDVNTCSYKTMTITGVDAGDTVILNVDGTSSSFAIANVWASETNEVKVKICNAGNADLNALAGIPMRFTIIK